MSVFPLIFMDRISYDFAIHTCHEIVLYGAADAERACRGTAVPSATRESYMAGPPGDHSLRGCMGDGGVSDRGSEQRRTPSNQSTGEAPSAWERSGTPGWSPLPPGRMVWPE